MYVLFTRITYSALYVSMIPSWSGRKYHCSSLVFKILPEISSPFSHLLSEPFGCFSILCADAAIEWRVPFSVMVLSEERTASDQGFTLPRLPKEV